MSEFYVPGSFESREEATFPSLHVAGLDYPDYLGAIDGDVFPNEPSLATEAPGEREREHLPQFGPAFVPYVVKRFNELEHLAAKALEKWSHEPVTVPFIAAMQSTSAGGIDQTTVPNAIIWETPPGFTLALHRIYIANGGNNFGTPFTGAGGYWELRVNNGTVDGGSLVSGSGSFPVVKTWGTRDAPHIRDGEVLSLFMASGPTSQTITVRGQGTLKRSVEG